MESICVARMSRKIKFFMFGGINTIILFTKTYLGTSTFESREKLCGKIGYLESEFCQMGDNRIGVDWYCESTTSARLYLKT